jgi:hypothetical protein
MPKKDINQTAFAVMQMATGEVVPEPIDEKKKAALEASRRGGLKGGAERAATLSDARRVEIAKLAASARWKKST